MIRAQFILELKKQSLLLYFIIGTVLVITLGLTSAHELSNTHSDWFGSDDAERTADGTLSSEQELVAFYVQQEMKQSNSSTRVEERTEQSVAKYNAQKSVLLALENSNYSRVNMIVSKFETENPELLQSESILPNDFQAYFGQNRYSAYYSTKYLVQHGKKYTLEIEGFSSVLTKTFTALRYAITMAGNQYELLALIIVSSAIVAMLMIFFKDTRAGTETFMSSSPLPSLVQAGIRSMVTVVLFNVLIVCAVTLVVGILSGIPGHPIGDLEYPFTIVIQGKCCTYPLWSILLQYLLLCNLWLVVLASIAFCMSNLVNNQLIGMAVAGLLAFAQPLKILELLPSAMTRLSPGHYVNFAQVTLHLGEFTDISLPMIVEVFLGWSAVFMILGVVLLWVREHRYVVALQ